MKSDYEEQCVALNEAVAAEREEAHRRLEENKELHERMSILQAQLRLEWPRRSVIMLQ